MARTLRAAPSGLRITIHFLAGALHLAIKRLQQTVVHASKLARPSAADPQPRCWEKDEPDGRQIHNEAGPVPCIHLQLHGDEWKGTCGSGLGKVLSDYVCNDTPDDPEIGRKGTDQPGSRAGSIDQASG
jgi:hypothetical protein